MVLNEIRPQRKAQPAIQYDHRVHRGRVSYNDAEYAHRPLNFRNHEFNRVYRSL